MIDFVWDNFGLIEWVLCIELVTMLSAGFFYQVAKLIARTDRHDPLVKFYRVFWQSFFSDVRSVRELDVLQAEVRAREAGLASAGRMTDDQLHRLDAPDLGDIGGVESTGTREPDQPVPSSVLEAMGLDADEAPRPAPAKKKAAPAASSNAAAEEQRALRSTFDARVVPFAAKDAIAGREGGELVVNVTVSPEDGQANGIIINLVSARIGLRPYQISLLRGHYKVRKTFQVAGMDQQALDARLAAM
jgi:uncharacterized protein YggU (UPF0235/DUF167 family)